jgi:hypothetical protein
MPRYILSIPTYVHIQSQSLLAFFWREFGMVVFFLEKKEILNIEISHL